MRSENYRGAGNAGEWEVRFRRFASTIGRWPIHQAAVIAAVQARCMDRAVELRRIREDGRPPAEPDHLVLPPTET